MRNSRAEVCRRSRSAGHWRRAANSTNNYLLDYELQKTKLFFGVLSNPLQDGAVQESMGAIYTRDREHLGTSDMMIIRTRRRMIRAAEAFAATATIRAITECLKAVVSHLPAD